MGTRTSGSEVRAGETTDRKVGTALRSDTYYWLADLLEELGCEIHLPHPSGLNWENRRVKNDERDALELPAAYADRIESLRELIRRYDREVQLVERELYILLKDHPGYNAIQVIPGVGKLFAAIFVAEIGTASSLLRTISWSWWPGPVPMPRPYGPRWQR